MSRGLRMSYFPSFAGKWRVLPVPLEGEGTREVVDADGNKVAGLRAAGNGQHLSARAAGIAALPELLEVLRRADQLCTQALPKFNWAASALDANAIALLNEVPAEIRAAIARVKS